MTSKSNIFTPPPHEETLFPRIWTDWFRAVYRAIVYFTIRSGIPTVSDLPNGTWMVYKDTAGGTLKIYANDNGTIKSVTLT
jgi:hypothetical protein